MYRLVCCLVAYREVDQEVETVDIVGGAGGVNAFKGLVPTVVSFFTLEKR